MGKKISNILFVEVKSPFHHIFSRTSIPRLGSVLLATILFKEGYNARVIVEDLKLFNTDMLNDIDLVAISTITSTAPRAFDIADKCKKRGIPVVIGGPHVTFLPDEALTHADYVVRGEGEIAIVKLVKALNADEPLTDIKGLSYKEGGSIVHNEMGEFIKDLDTLPIPDFSLIDNWSYGNVIPFATSRGCPFRCKFCSVIKMFGTSMRFQSVDRVIKELKHYAKQSRHVFFCDDNFTANKSRAKKILRRMISENIKIEWSAQVRVDAAKDDELLRLMRKTRCFCVFIGFESVNPKTLLEYDKRQSITDMRSAITKFHKYNMHIHGMFVLGSMHDDAYTIKNTAKFARSTKLDSVQFLILTPLPGTDTYYEMEKEGVLITKDWHLYDSHHVVFKPKGMSPYELQVGSIQAMRKFYSWKTCLRHLVNFNFFYFFVHLYGIKSIKRLFHENALFIVNLKKSLFEEAIKLKKYLPHKKEKVERIVIPEDVLTRDEQTFLYYFFKNIGLSVKIIKAGIHPKSWPDDLKKYIGSHMKSFKKKAGIIILPVGEKYSYVDKYIQEMTIEFKEVAKNIKFMPCNVANVHKNFYDFCLNFGLALDRKLKKINKAYSHAQKQTMLKD
jgi:radical SAM superfamily enzyme YgiQ (UPF0313 family)